MADQAGPFSWKKVAVMCVSWPVLAAHLLAAMPLVAATQRRDYMKKTLLTFAAASFLTLGTGLLSPFDAFA
ncbi:MAG: hypothetical protein IT461_09220 [Planctomycetes bacterium]|nr:hypothetical protein [Planctomycetota bacterium]